MAVHEYAGYFESIELRNRKSYTSRQSEEARSVLHVRSSTNSAWPFIP